MKKVIILTMGMLLFLHCPGSTENLYGRFKDYPAIRIFLKEVTNSSKNEIVDIKEFREIFKDVSRDRIEIDFVIVDKPEDADVVVTADVKGFEFMEKVLPRPYSHWAVVADITAPKNFAKLVVDYDVIDAKSGKLLYEHKNFVTEDRLPRHKHDRLSSYKNIVRKNINRFLFRTFYKEQHPR